MLIVFLSRTNLGLTRGGRCSVKAGALLKNYSSCVGPAWMHPNFRCRAMGWLAKYHPDKAILTFYFGPSKLIGVHLFLRLNPAVLNVWTGVKVGE